MLGFIFRSCKHFRNPDSLITLYHAYVQSRVDYCSIIWSPMYQNSIDKIESVQRRFSKMLYRKFNRQYDEYPDRLMNYIADEMFLYKSIHQQFATNYITQFTLADTIRTNRQF